MKYWLRSLSFRAVTFSTIWAVAAFVVIATLITALYRDASERSFHSLLSAHLYSLVAAVGVSEEGRLQGGPELYDLRFTDPGSGWYWSVEPVSQNLEGQLRSPSMTQPIEAPSVAAVPFDAQFQRRYEARGIDGERVEVLENDFILDEENRIARFRIMGNRTELEQDIARFERQLFGYLALFGFGMVGINAIAILFGLKPLDQVRNALAQVREGTAKKLDGAFPSEIAPLAEETNALIDNNRRIVERARTQVGNLAHALKTPLAVLLNEGRRMGGSEGGMVVDQAAAMQEHVEYYLQRARVAAQRESVVYRAPVRAALERLVRVMQKLNPDKEIRLLLPDEEIHFAGEAEDFEELAGNIVENAMKWSRRNVRVSLSAAARDKGTGELLLVVEDDGPGIPQERIGDVVKRGHRLDESKPGSGLGLSIVSEMTREYGGAMELGDSPLGGLRVNVRLPAAS
ncbi:ATP-binding protein [Mesorhizobium xinjiangense]|uniref:ATP-binding protein n=1 Tax=Mesorhizobium xinjiangense TaxID=2678685 RepID=UPI0012EE3970|nr:ATP-binding protein [Mesorhizobium xinjiangense]